MPSWVGNEEEKPVRPWAALWISVHEDIVHASEPRPVEEVNFSLAFTTLVEFACDQKLAGYLPGKIEVRDSALAEYLSGQLMDTGVEVKERSKLQYLDRIIIDMAEHLAGGKLPPNATDTKGVGLDEMQGFANAASVFYQAKPWQYLVDEDLIEIESPFINAGFRYVIVMGHGGQTYGLSFFDSKKQYESIMECEPGEFFSKNQAWSVTFGPIMELPFGDADLWEDHSLTVAGDEAYPVALCYGPGNKIRRPGPHYLAFIEGLMQALAETSEKEIDAGKWQKSVQTNRGSMEFALVLPDVLEPPEERTPDRIKMKGKMPDQRSMEQDMANIQKILNEREFSGIQEMNEFLNKNFTGKKVPEREPSTPLEKAQDIVYQAFEVRGRRQIIMARKALEICQDCTDAYVLLAEHVIEVKEAYDLYQQGVLAGERALGEKFFKKESGNFWGIIETRPYMRARWGMAQSLEAMRKYKEATEHYQEMLKLNPQDNQGVRHVLLLCLLRTHQDEKVEVLLKENKEDKALAIWSYVRALLSFRRKGNTAASRKHLDHAFSVNPHVAEYLLNEEDLPEGLPDGYSLGSKQEAVICADQLLDVWQETPGAIEWLDENHEAL